MVDALTGEIFLHPGLIKTGTTYLQEEVFPKLKLNYYYKPDILSQKFKGDKILISMEELCHNEYKPNNPELLKYDFETLKKLSKLFPNSKIIIGVRNCGFKKSLYSRYLLEGSSLTYKEFKERINKDFIQYDEYVDTCKNLFNDVFVYSFEDLRNNKGKVIEDLCNFMKIPIIKKISNAKHNTALSPIQKETLRLINKFKIFKIPGFSYIFRRFIRKYA